MTSNLAQLPAVKPTRADSVKPTRADSGRLKYRQLVILFSTAVCLFYLTYRGLFTLNLSTPYAVFCSLFLYIGECFGVFSVLLFFLQVWDTREPPPLPVLEGRTVDVFVPTYNEDPGILRATLEACQRMDYPHRTYLCDDGGTDLRVNDADPNKAKAARERAATLKAICAELGVTYMTRPDNRHAKAGNLNHAFEQTDGEFIIIFDADHVPEPHFISRLIGYFRDEKLGFVQTPHAFYNFDSFQARHDHERQHYWEEGHLFYNVIQPGRNRWGCPIFAGAAAMFRRSTLESVGYIATETITEDMHTGMRMHSRGWTSLGISERMIVGQAAPDITTFHTQRLRWGEGNLSIMAYDNPLTMRGLTFSQRLCYFGSMIHWAGGLFKLPIYLTPILMMFTGVPPVNQFSWTLGLITLLYLFVAIFGVRIASDGYLSVLNAELFCMVNFWTQIRGTMRALFWRKFQKFVVTSKRGRQSKSIWPFIRPQVVLAALSVLALVWGWSRIGFGISDDVYKPIIPTFWIVFHLWLVAGAIRRALRPEDQRYAYRHAVSLPVVYAFKGIEGEDGQLVRQVRDVRFEELSAMAVTVDLSEGGVGLITYGRLPVGTILQLTIWGRGETLECEGRVQWVKEITPPVAGAAKGYRCGIAFRNLEPSQVDVLNRICLHYAVPRLYRQYEEGHKKSFGERLAAMVPHWLWPRRFAIRYAYHLPLVLKLGDTRGTTYYAVTEEVSRVAVAALLPFRVPRGTTAELTIPTPLGEVRGQGRLVREEIRNYAARDYQYAVFEMLHFEEQGRVTLESLINPRENSELIPALKPKRHPRRVPILRAAAIFWLAMLPASVLSLGALRFCYRDDFYLRDMVAEGGPLTPEQAERVDRICSETLAQGYASTDRLSLLMRVLTKMDRKDELSQVARLIAPRDRGNLDLQLALAQALDNTKDYDEAESEYQRLLQRANDESLPPARKRNLLLGAARSSVHAGKVERAGQRFDELLRLTPDDSSLRNECAGVYLSADRPRDALALFNGVEPDLDGRLLLVAINARLENYDAAEDQARRVLALRPGDPDAERLLADVLSWKKGFAQSRAIYERLARVRGSSPELDLRLAQVALWSKNYDEALVRFQALIDRKADNPEIVQGYVDAASSAEKLDDSQKRTALMLHDRLLTATTKDAVLLARLAWVLQRVNEHEKAAALLDRAVAMKPSDPTLRKQLFGALVTAGRLTEALDGLDPERMDLDTRRFLVGLHLKNKNNVAAAGECRRILKENPGDLKTERLLADILSWNKQYKESLSIFEGLRKKLPNDAEIPLRIAEVTMWAGEVDPPLVLLLFQTLLEKDFYQTAAQRGFVDAAGRVEKLTSPQLRLALRICEGVRARDVKDVPFLTRLAWVLHLEKQKEKADHLLDAALSLRPQEPEARKELAGVLAAMGRNDAALELYKGLTLTLEDRYRLAGLYASAKNYEAAATTCRAILKEKPADPKARRLLADVLSWDKKYEESQTLFDRLVEEDPDDAALGVRQAEVALWSGKHDQALTLFRRLLERRFDQPKLWPDYVNAASASSALTDTDGRLATRIAEQLSRDHNDDLALLTRLAWVLTRVKETARARALLDQVVARKPDEPALRKELAGVLSAAGQHEEALAQYDGLTLAVEDRYQLASLHAAARDFAAAAEQCHTIMKEKPGDRRARRLLADVLSWAGKYAESLALFEALIKDGPQDEDAKVRQAEVTLWSGDRPRALSLFQALLAVKFERSAAWAGYISAAASAEKLTPEQFALAVRISEQAGRADDAAFLSRLGWVLFRGGDKLKARSVLDRAVALKPKGPAVRRELAGVLAAAGRAKEALALHEGLTPEPEDHYRLAGLYASINDFAEAERQCRAFLKEKPGDEKMRRLLADVLSWAKKYKESLALFEQLAKENPEDIGLAVRLAEVTLWSGDADGALALFRPLLETEFDRKDLWSSYVNAAAGAKALTEMDRQLMRQIGEKLRPADGMDPAAWIRLASVLARLGERARASALLDRALALNPESLALRKELAGALGAVGRHREALLLYRGLATGPEDCYQLALLHAGARNFKAAVEQCQALIAKKPGDRKARRLLADILSWDKKYRESLNLLAELLQEEPDSDELKSRQAEVTLWAGDREKALTLFEALLEEKFERPTAWAGYVAAAASAEKLTAAQRELVKKIDGRLSADCKDSALLSRLAWVFHREGEKAKAQTLLDRALALKPAEPVVKRELAGVLGATGRHKEALAMYDGLPLVAEDRYRLAGLYSAVKDYRAAAEQCRILLTEKPNDAPARRMLADILSWDKKYRESLELFEQLLKESPGDEALKLRRAEVTLWAGNYDAALALFQPILEAKLDQPKLWPAFIDAAASAKTVTSTSAPIALRIAEGLLAGKPESATPLSRLAWVLFRLKQQEKAMALLDKALALRPVEAAVRKELAGVLAAVGRRQHALDLYRGLELDPDDRFRIAEMYAAEEKLDDAEREARAAMKARPDDRKSVWLLADVLLWNRKYEEAGKLFRTLQEAEPNNPLLPQRLAELALWSGAYDEAVERFQKLVAGDLDQPTYWKSFVDAAASAKKLNDDNKRTALHLYEVVRKNGAKDAVYLSRLAWVLRRSSEKEKAVDLLRKALALSPQSRPIRSELAETLYETGHFDEAEKHFSILLRSRP